MLHVEVSQQITAGLDEAGMSLILERVCISSSKSHSFYRGVSVPNVLLYQRTAWVNTTTIRSSHSVPLVSLSCMCWHQWSYSEPLPKERIYTSHHLGITNLANRCQSHIPTSHPYRQPTASMYNPSRRNLNPSQSGSLPITGRRSGDRSTRTIRQTKDRRHENTCTRH